MRVYTIHEKYLTKKKEEKNFRILWNWEMKLLTLRVCLLVVSVCFSFTKNSNKGKKQKKILWSYRKKNITIKIIYKIFLIDLKLIYSSSVVVGVMVCMFVWCLYELIWKPNLDWSDKQNCHLLNDDDDDDQSNAWIDQSINQQIYDVILFQVLLLNHLFWLVDLVGDYFQEKKHFIFNGHSHGIFWWWTEKKHIFLCVCVTCT